MNDDYEVVIEPNQKWLTIDWRGLLHYRDLLFLLVRRDFVAKYKQTVLGPLWFILQPLLTTIVFTVIFGKVARIPTDGIPPLLFYLCGLLGWNYFAQVLNSTGNSFQANANIFGKVYFPRIIMPLSVTVSNLIAFAIQLTTFLAFYFYFRLFTAAGEILEARWTLLLFPLLVFHTAALGLGVGFWMSALTAKYRDFVHLLGFLVQLWMYATPVIYPLSQIPAQWRWVAVLNPMTTIVELYKYSFLGVGVVGPVFYFISLLLTVFLFLSGLFLFQKTARTFVDTV